MSRTIKKALQEAIKVHKAGKLQDAEVCYRSILQIQPKHPDANHNLGLIADSLNKPEAALLLFKTALEASPSQGRFWISYIEALIKNNQIEHAKSVLNQGKKMGLAGERVNVLNKKLTSTNVEHEIELSIERQGGKYLTQDNKNLVENGKSNKLAKKHSQKEINDLLEDYENKRYNKAEGMARSIIQRIPTHQLSWKILAATLKQTGRLEEALIASRKTVELVPNDAEALSNLGNVLQELGRLEEAETRYLATLALKPNFAEVYYNLGNVLQELGNLEEAEKSYKKAIKLKPSLAIAHNNLANILRKLDRLDEAESSYRKAINFKPDLIQAHSNLGITLKKLNKPEEAEVSFGKAIELQPEFTPALLNRGAFYFEQEKFELAIKDFDLCGTQDASSRSLASLYSLGYIDEIYQRIEILTQQDEKNIRVAAFSAFIVDWQKKETSNKFCQNPLDFLHISNLSRHHEDSTLFITELIEDLYKVKPVWEPLNKSTHNGFQSRNNLFQNQLKKINYLQSIIENELDSYYSKFKNIPCIFMSKWPAKKNLHGWYVILKQQGYQSVHIHPSGWLSGVIYLQVVPSLEQNEGSIEFSLSGEHFFHAESPKIIYQPKLGDIVFFPSSLHHRTLPFSTNTERIIVSFDLLPVEK